MYADIYAIEEFTGPIHSTRSTVHIFDIYQQLLSLTEVHECMYVSL